MNTNYHIKKSCPAFVYIIDDYNDCRPTMTITNAASEIVRTLFESELLDAGQRLFYKDTEGLISEIVWSICYDRSGVETSIKFTPSKEAVEKYDLD